jgi:protein tyrosine phosphatase
MKEITDYVNASFVDVSIYFKQDIYVSGQDQECYFPSLLVIFLMM